MRWTCIGRASDVSVNRVDNQEAAGGRPGNPITTPPPPPPPPAALHYRPMCWPRRAERENWQTRCRETGVDGGAARYCGKHQPANGGAVAAVDTSVAVGPSARGRGRRRGRGFRAAPCLPTISPGRPFGVGHGEMDAVRQCQQAPCCAAAPAATAPAAAAAPAPAAPATDDVCILSAGGCPSVISPSKSWLTCLRAARARFNYWIRFFGRIKTPVRGSGRLRICKCCRRAGCRRAGKAACLLTWSAGNLPGEFICRECKLNIRMPGAGGGVAWPASPVRLGQPGRSTARPARCECKCPFLALRSLMFELGGGAAGRDGAGQPPASAGGTGPG